MKEILSTAYLMGGLGNQMFQISHALCQAWKNNVTACFRPISFTPMSGNQPINYMSNILRNINFRGSIENTTILKYPFHFVNVDLTWNESLEFYGYFQSSKYFYGYEDRIKATFIPTNAFIEKIQEQYPQIKKENTLSLHIRRGDYLTISNVLPTVDLSYFDECLKINGEYDALFIFTDDKAWTRKNLSYENMIIVDDLADYEELWMMSLCKNNILSNSSFSWWGAFLNVNQNSKKFAPSQWFGPAGEANFSDIYESDWKIINVHYIDGKLIYI